MTHNIISQYNDLSSLITLYMHCDLYTGITECKRITCRFQWWPCGLRRRSAAARLLRSWVRIPPGTWMFVCCECRVLSGRGLCDELITRPEKSFRPWCVVVCDLKTSRMRRPWPALGRSATEKKTPTSYKRKLKRVEFYVLLQRIISLRNFCSGHDVLRAPESIYILDISPWNINAIQ